tara:strand:- start:108 stop:566 length:459 start_codon:yes stop_codon:yes gene_type:complete
MSKEFLNNYNKRIIKEIMNIMIPENEDIAAAGNKGLIDELEKLFFDSEFHINSIKRILNAINLNSDARLSGSFFSLNKEKKIEILKSLEKNMFDDFHILKECIFGTYYCDDEVMRKIGWDNDFINKAKFGEYTLKPNILNKVKKITPFWRKV